MDVLIIKLGATGDVVRTTPILHRLSGDVTWITAAKNRQLVDGLPGVRCYSWEERASANDREYDLVISLEDEIEVGRFVSQLRFKQIFGAFLEGLGMTYTRDSALWFDLGLISTHGRARADQLKLQNRRSYQDLIFEGLGFSFSGEEYLLPSAPASDLAGDVALSPVAGPVWPMKAWAFYDQLKDALTQRGYRVNVLPTRGSLLEHMADIQGHQCLISGDSLPMHLALGSKIPCVSIFTCTSPWEIFGYGRQSKLISPLLEEFFYKRGFDLRATTAVSFETVLEESLTILRGRVGAPLKSELRVNS